MRKSHAQIVEEIETWHQAYVRDDGGFGCRCGWVSVPGEAHAELDQVADHLHAVIEEYLPPGWLSRNAELVIMAICAVCIVLLIVCAAQAPMP